MRITAELAADHTRELRNSLIWHSFPECNAAIGFKLELLDNAIDLLFEGSMLSTWRYRIALAAIRQGL